MAFDDRNIAWLPFGDFTGFAVSVCKVDVQQGTAEFLIRFEPKSQIQLHRHMCDTSTLVLSGEHRLYDPDGNIQDIRTVGSYTFSPPGSPHREGAGEQPSVVFYILRSEHGLAFEFLNDDLSLLAPLGITDVDAFWQMQQLAAVGTP